MRRRTVRLATIAVVLGGVLILGAGAAQAHPLGNFTINLYDGLSIRAHGLDVDHVVDMAEIPAFQERTRIDTDGDGQISTSESAAYVEGACAAAADGLKVTVGGTEITPTPGAAGSLALPPGAGGLSTLRLECSLHADVTIRPDSSIAFRDDADPGRIGWHEVTAVGVGMTLASSDVPTTSTSERLTSYPADLLSSPLDQRSASIVAGSAADTGAAPATDLATAPIARGFGDRFTTAFAGLVTTGGSSPVLWLFALATAFAIGGLHALGPGHGKTLMAAYLVGTDVRPRQVVAVGAAVSAMHTASVVALGFAVLAAGQAFTPEVAYRWTTLASGGLVALLGAYLLLTRSRAVAHGRAHEHSHDHDHTHEPRPGRFGLATLAVSGGILPSPSALIALLAAVAIGRLVFGLALVLAFGVGLATVLMGVGFGTIRMRDLMGRRLPGALATWAPIVSAAGICLLGVVLVARTVMA
ncbi:MAG: nickel transporter [Actinomycetota bacterium]